MSFSIDQFRLDGKVAIVTGAGGRGDSIGRAFALGLSRAGARVVAADIQAEGAQEVCDETASAGGSAIAVSLDITKPDSVRKMAATAREAFGGVDILVNNAALMAELGYVPAADIPLDQWNRIMDVNLTRALNCEKAGVPLKRESGKVKMP